MHSFDPRFPAREPYFQVAAMTPHVDLPAERSLCLVGHMQVRYPVFLAEAVRLRGWVAEPARMVTESIAGTGTRISVEVLVEGERVAGLVRELRTRSQPAERTWNPIELDLQAFSGRQVVIVFESRPLAPAEPGDVAYGLFARLRLAR